MKTKQKYLLLFEFTLGACMLKLAGVEFSTTQALVLFVALAALQVKLMVDLTIYKASP